ncbi:MAG: hypothetical protein PHE09_16805, partial [Oscillospiraceae bacterium]|nr:hypothetical protein [Oscillospiraceae bacterium]
EDELTELKKLLGQNKPVMVVITKSDYTKNDIQNGKRVSQLFAKSPENRKLQDEYVMGEILRLGNGNIENRRVVSLSSKLARQALAGGDAPKFESSNMGLFYKQISEILSDRAVELKMRRPITEINHCIDELVNGNHSDRASIRSERNSIAECLSVLDEVDRQRSEMTKHILEEINSILPTTISARLRSLRERGQLGQPDQVRAVVADCISTVCASQCAKANQEQFRMAENALPKMDVIQLDEKIGDGYKKTMMQVTYQAMEQRAPKGLAEKIIVIFNKNKKFYRSVERLDDVAVGDNFNALLQQIIEAIRPDLPNFIEQAVNELYSQCLNPLRDRYSQMDKQFETLEIAVKNLKL